MVINMYYHFVDFCGGKKAEIKQYLKTHETVNHLLVKIPERGFPNLSPTMTLNVMYYKNLIYTQKENGSRKSLIWDKELIFIPFL